VVHLFQWEGRKEWEIMASTESLAARQHDAMTRLKSLRERLSNALGVDLGDLPKKAKDNFLQRVQDLENMADTLERVADKVAPRVMEVVDSAVAAADVIEDRISDALDIAEEKIDAAVAEVSEEVSEMVEEVKSKASERTKNRRGGK
jgi:hypothetical protein